MSLSRCALVLMLGAGITFSVRAEGKPPRMAIHPLVVVGEDQTDVALNKLFVQECRKTGFLPADSALVLGELTRVPNRSCLGSDACLARLAGATGAERAMLVTLSAYSPQLILTGRVVSARGELLVSLEGAAFPKGTPLKKAIEQALREFVPRLKVPPPAPPPPAPGPMAAGPASSALELREVTPTPSPPGSGMRTAAWVLWSASAVCVASASGLAWSAEQDRQQLTHQLDEEGNLPEELPASYSPQRQKEGLSTALFIGGGAAAIAGGVLWWLAPASSVSVAPAANGVSVSGRF